MNGAAPSTRDPRVAGLYAVTPDLDDTGRLVAMVEAALRGGAAIVQYRNKSADAALRMRQAVALGELCTAHGRPLIVNDHLDVALSIDGAGLHVGSDDFAGPDALRALRRELGRSRLFGVSCYRSIELARDAAAAGAHYVAFGSVFPSTTKPSAPAAALATFDAARPIGVAVVGIGGITHLNLPSLIEAGADAAAVIADLFVGSNEPGAIESRARRLADCFRDTRRTLHTRRPP